jgi:dephospho-CoA kinase
VRKPKVIIGLTGLYCAGKNHAALLLEKRGLPVLDVDKLGHEVLRTETEKIVRRFGADVLGPGGLADRRLLGKRVFGKPEELAALEEIVHPAVNRLISEWIARQSGPCVINAALLHRASVYGQLKAVVVVKAPFLTRFFRAWKRDKLPPRELLKRFLDQKHFPRYKTKINADGNVGNSQLISPAADTYIVRNSGFPGSVRRQEKRIDVILEGLYYGKEKTVIGSGFCGNVSGNRGKRRDSGL